MNGLYSNSKRGSSIDAAEDQVKVILKAIKDLSNIVGFYGESLEIDSHDPDTIFRKGNLGNLMDQLDDIYGVQSYLMKDVKYEGNLHKNSDGRYEFDNGTYFTSGSVLEVLTYDNHLEQEVWEYGAIEHSGGDYFHTALGKGKSLDGVYARKR